MVARGRGRARGRRRRRLGTRYNARRHCSRIARAPAHRHRARVPDRRSGGLGVAVGALRCVPGFRSPARVGADRGARPRCNPGRGLGDAPARGFAGGNGKRQDGTIDFEPGAVRDAGGLRSFGRSLPATAGGDRTAGGIRRTAAARRGRAAAVAAQLVHGIPGAFRLHQRPFVGARIARHRAVDRQAADTRPSPALRRRRFSAAKCASARSSSTPRSSPPRA